MPKPNAFYYTPAQGRLQFTQTPTGILDVNQLIIGKAPWVAPNPCEIKKKKIILADWTAGNWSANKIIAVQTALMKLIAEGFSLYVEQSGLINPLLKKDLPDLKNKSFRDSITIDYPDKIVQSAAIQQRLVRDEIFVLDDYWLDYLLGTDNVYKARNARISDINRAKQTEVLDIIIKSSPPVTSVIYDVFSSVDEATISALRSNYPNININSQYAEALFGRWKNMDAVLDALKERLIDLEEMDLSDSDITAVGLEALLGRASNIKKLALNKCKKLNEPFKINSSLNQLQELSFHGCSISTSDLQALLMAAVTIQKIDLTGCKKLAEPFTLAANSLPCLEEINLFVTNISEDNLQVLLAAAPNIKILKLEFCRLPTLKIKEGSLKYLEEIDLSRTQITTAGLQALLKAIPGLKKLRLTRPNCLTEAVNLEPGSLSHLEEIDLSSSNITTAGLQALLIAASHLKKLTLLHCCDLREKLDTKVVSLSDLEELVLATGESMTLALLAATPKLKKLELVVGMEMLHIKEGSLNCVEEIDLGHCYLLTNLEMILKASPNLQRLYANKNSQYLGDFLTLKKNSLMHLKETNINIHRLLATNVQVLMAAAPNLEFQSRQLDKNIVAGSEPQQPVDQAHTVSSLKDFKPTLENAPFQYRGKNKTINQGMITEKFCQHLTLTQQHLKIIPELQDGICNALSHFFVASTDKDWNIFIEEVIRWNGQSPCSELLNNQFTELWRYIKKYQLYDNGQRWFIGEQVEFLAGIGKPCVLFNSWHAVAIKPGNQKDSWILYDPNYVKGARDVFGIESLKEEIHTAVGSLLFIENSNGIKPLITSFNTFLEQGGLWVLIGCNNAQELLTQIPLYFDMPLDALDGLLLRNNKGIPAWAAGIQHPDKAIAQLTHRLLQQFMHKNPSYQKDLQKSMEVLSALQRQECSTLLIQSMPDISSLEKQQQLISLIRMPVLGHSQYEKRLKTWLKPKERPMTSLEYAQHCMQKAENTKSVLIELSASAQLNALRYVLEQYAQKTQRPLFYVHSPDDLVYLKTVIGRNGNRGQLQKARGGPFYEFLYANQNKSPVVIVNYEQFQAEDMVRLNSLLEVKSSVIPMPSETLIIGLLNINKADCYQGADFYSRMDRIETCPVSTETLEQAIPRLFLIQEKHVQEGGGINLFHAADWKERLLGSWILAGDGLHFKEGELVPALQTGKPLIIQNGLWKDAEFNRFWHEAFLRGSVHHAGREIAIPENVILNRQEGYDWETLTDHFQLSVRDFDSSQHAEILNPNCFTYFFSRYEYLQSTLVNKPGFIEAHKGKVAPLSVYLTRTLGEELWAMLLSECQRYGVQLQVHCAPSVTLPQILGVVDASGAEKTIWNGKIVSATQIIISTDVDTSVALLNKIEAWQVMDISECKPADLLMRINATLDEEQLNFEFQQTQGALLQGLGEQKNILLKGYFSVDLADQLASLLLERQASDAPFGRLVLVSDEAAFFQYLPSEFHTVTTEEKMACLGELTDELSARLEPFIATESLSKLQARRDFWQNNPALLSSDENWQGLRDLPGRKQTLAPFNYQTSVQETLVFTQQRRDLVNNLLAKSPYVFLAGLSGVGKSTFVAQELCQGNDQLYQGEGRIRDWAANTSSIEGRKLLFLDEATLSVRNWSEFEGLFESPPGILVDGTYYPLTKEHKVIFAGNPVSYGDERQLATLFQRHGKTLFFEPLPAAVLYQKILKPVFEKFNAEMFTVVPAVTHFLDVYRFLVDIATTDVLISPRELQMMALLTVSYCQKNPDANALEAARHYAFALARHLVPEAHQANFDSQFKPTNSLQRRKPVASKDFLMTASRINMAQHLEDILALRQLRQQGVFINDAQKYGGLGGIVFEGEPGIGKTELVMSTLLASDFKKITGFSKPVAVDKSFYHLPASLSVSDKEALLLKAFDEGAVVVIDEVNSSPRMERLLNDLLMGKKPANDSSSDKPDKPGFVVIGTQNPVTMAGRRAPSTALSRRLTTYTLPLYSNEEMHDILMQKGIEADDATSIITLFNKNAAYAKKNQLSPAPTFRDVLRLADEIVKANARLMQQASGSNLMVVRGKNSFVNDNDTLINQVIKRITEINQMYDLPVSLIQSLANLSTELSADVFRAEIINILKEISPEQVKKKSLLINPHNFWNKSFVVPALGDVLHDLISAIETSRENIAGCET